MKLQHIIFVLLFIIGSAFPQDSVFTPKYALSFGIDHNFTLTKFNGEIALKKILENSDQIRILFQPFFNVYTSDYPVLTVSTDQNYEKTLINMAIGADYLWIVFTHNDISLFVGPGISFSYGYINDKYKRYLEPGVFRLIEYEKIIPGFALRGTLSAEWKINDKIGIHSEYRLNFGFENNKVTEIFTTTGIAAEGRGIKTNISALTSIAVFGLSIYF